MTYYSALHYAAKAEKSATAAAKSAEDTAKYAETFNPDNIVNVSTNQTISGVKTFNSSPILKSATPDTVAIITDEGYLTGYDGISRTELGYLDGVTSNIQTQLNDKAPLASPALTGNPTAPTQAVGNNSTRVATTAYVNIFQPVVTALSATSGTVSLAVNKIYTISVSGTTTFSLPTPSNTNVFNQIKVMMKVTGTPTINWGTTRFFNKKTPEIKEGNYDVYFDYDRLLGGWVCGVIAKGTAS